MLKNRSDTSFYKKDFWWQSRDYDSNKFWWEKLRSNFSEEKDEFLMKIWDMILFIKNDEF